MRREVSIYKAQKLAHSIDDVAIVINTELPQQDYTLPTYLTESVKRFEEQADLLFVALRDTLPGGTMDRLIAKLLIYKASHFVVNFETKPEPRVKEGD